MTPTILELADEYAKAYFMGRPEEARKKLQAAVMTAEVEAHAAEKAARSQAFLDARYELGKGGAPEEIDARLRDLALADYKAGGLLCG